MGNGSSSISSRSHRTSINRRNSSNQDIVKKINDKHYKFIALNGDIMNALKTRDQKAVKSLTDEIAADIIDMKQFSHFPVPPEVRERANKILENYKVSLATLNSINDLSARPEPATQFYINKPDIVTSSAAPSRPPESASSSVSESMEDKFFSIENELEVLKNKLERQPQNCNEYCQIDKGLFYLQVQLTALNFETVSSFCEKKQMLLKTLQAYRTFIEEKKAELEEQQRLDQEVTRFAIEFDKVTKEEEIKSLYSRGLLLQKTIEKTPWDSVATEAKMHLLRRLAKVLEDIAYVLKPSSKEENIYGNLQQQEEALEAIDRVLEDDDEPVYGNVDDYQQVDKRGTVYVNAEIVSRQSSFNSQKNVAIRKAPLPLPRLLYDEQIVEDLPKHWVRLNSIFSGDVISDDDMKEVVEIRHQAEVARTLFERKIRQIEQKCLERNILEL